MPLNLTEEQILQLAPRRLIGKGRQRTGNLKQMGTEGMQRTCRLGALLAKRKESLPDGDDLNDIAFKCSCLSRKFPCKHGLGLLLLYARQPDQFTQAEEPEWVTAWLAKRTEKAEKKEQKTKSETPVDEAAQTKRQEKRHQKVLGGISDLEVWMKDLMRNGFPKCSGTCLYPV